MVSFCWLNVMVHLQTHRHKAEPSCSHSQGLCHSLNNIAPGILSVSLLNPFFPFMAMLEVSQRQNSSAFGACTMEDRHLRLQLGEGGGGGALLEARVCPGESRFVGAPVSGCHLETIVLPKGPHRCNPVTMPLVFFLPKLSPMGYCLFRTETKGAAL